jgi:hypothetical protein
MSKFKINLFCNDSLLPSTSDKNVSKYTEWVKDGSGEINLYVNQKCLDVFSDTSTKRRYIWLLESRQIIPNIFDFVEKNYEFLLTRCDGIFTCDKELCKIPGFKYVISNAAPWVEDRKIFDKTKLVSMISSNKSYTEGHKKRLEYVNQFKDMVDLYGRGIKDIACKEDGLRDYMFSISIENAVYDTYFTEKLTDCFSTGTIPIFYGSDKVVEYFNEDGIIFLDENFNISILTEELYNSKKDAIVDNFERSINLPIAEDYMFENYFQ